MHDLQEETPRVNAAGLRSAIFNLCQTPGGRSRGCGRCVEACPRDVIRLEPPSERLLHLVTRSEGMIVLPGGIGTLSEMTLAWSFLLGGTIWEDVPSPT